MRRRRKIRPDAILHTPKLLPMPNAEGSIRSLSLQFLLDFEQHWRIHGSEVLDRLAEQQPAAYFAGAVSLAKVMRIELGKPEEFDRPMTPEEIIDKLEQRIGHEGRVIFENFVREINRLEAEQQLEQQQQQQEQERRRQQHRQQQRQTVPSSGAAGDDAVERALAIAERWRAAGTPTRERNP